MGTRWHPNHPLWLQWQREKAARTSFDTLDGSAAGWRNDVFDAYNPKGPKGMLL